MDNILLGNRENMMFMTSVSLAGAAVPEGLPVIVHGGTFARRDAHDPPSRANIESIEEAMTEYHEIPFDRDCDGCARPRHRFRR